jgi:hypothetical protein
MCFFSSKYLWESSFPLPHGLEQFPLLPRYHTCDTSRFQNERSRVGHSSSNKNFIETQASQLDSYSYKINSLVHLFYCRDFLWTERSMNFSQNPILGFLIP